ncbi:hypothetical protein BDR26DRAFT_1014415 [Obelidium mucronatum]|nr:hypothetical protein BDR26DRAFT_1014415 [Obelidium mucronatum]
MAKVEELSISEEDQLRIIEQTGIINKLKQKEKQQQKQKQQQQQQTLFDSDDDEDNDGFNSESENQDSDNADDDDKPLKPLIDLSQPFPLHQNQNNPNNNEEEDLIFNTLLLAIPLTILHSALEYVIHVQYGFSEKYNLTYITTHSLPFFAALFVVMVTTGRVKQRAWMQAGFAVVAAACGVYIIKVSDPTKHEPFGVMIQTAGVSVLWIYSVIQSRLGFSVCGVGVPLFYYWLQGWRDGGSGGGAGSAGKFAL